MHDKNNDSQNNDSQNNANEGWEPCPQGILSDVVQSQKANLPRRSIPIIPLAATIAALLLVTVYSIPYWLTPSEDERHGGISCNLCISKMDEYHHGKLTVKEVAVVDDHLGACVMCRKKYNTALDKLSDYVHDVYRVAFVVPSYR